MKRIKVLFVITQAGLGGAQRWVFDVATGLADQGYQVAVAAGETIGAINPINPISPIDPIGLIGRLKAAGLPARRLRWLRRNINPLFDLLAIGEIYRLIRREQPDILQLCSTKAGFAGALAGRLANVPKILYRIGGWSFNDPRPAWQNKIFFWLEKLSAPLKDKIIVNSQHDFAQALALKICPREKLFLLYNGIDPEKIRAQKAKFKTTNQNSKITIGCIANNYPSKGLKYLYQALEILSPKPYTLNPIIVGQGTAVGPKENPWQYLLEQGLDIFVIPSLKEGVPYVLLEAMAVGLPIVATNVGGIPEIIKNGENGLLLPAGDSRALAQAIKNLADQPELRRRLAAQVQLDVEKFSLEQMLAEYTLQLPIGN